MASPLKCFTGYALVFLVGCGGGTPPTGAPKSAELTPDQRPAELTPAEFDRRFPQEQTSRSKAFVAARAQVAQCAAIPTQAEVNTAQLSYQDYYMSAKRAASIGIPIVNASGQSDFLVIIRDYKRFKACTATDNKTVLHYGQVIRAVIELTGYQGDVKLTLAALAATATLQGKQQYFYLYKNGWYSPKADGILATVSGKVFDVENYALYQGVMPQLIALLSDASTALAPALVLMVPPEDDPTFVMASARGFGFTQAKDGKSCQDAAKKFAKDPGRFAAIVDAYAFLGKPNCTSEKIVEPEKSKAKALLGGLSVN